VGSNVFVVALLGYYHIQAEFYAYKWQGLSQEYKTETNQSPSYIYSTLLEVSLHDVVVMLLI